MSIEVVVADQFMHDAAKLSKRYPNILNDVRALRTRLEAGELPGDRIKGLTQQVYKARISNRDARRGKSGSYRVIYYLETGERRVLITIYSKSDQSDIPTATLRRYLLDYELK